ncbi:phosphoinositide 3-kinase regulatory subunit 6 [Hippoglossus hippoglossus]|uniref:phosphoinositide 3-kinase regulatory subunit 6 n=1 Tax=Hippoglossus hippoglossus TaxID=8267 RepID=UPI00148CD958|nr:phosphoinositide 3-kinase regulatory subunit 6 [Hippoglossus hippoglossus]
MTDLAADVSLSAVQSGLHTDVQALLNEMNSRCTSQKGWIRWSLEKKVEVDPSCSVSLISVLVRELEKKLKKMHKIGSHVHVIPILHTLYYAVIQSGSMIPRSLYQRVDECLMKLLILPIPYSAVALSTLSSVKMEMITPGSLYQRRVIAEQNLKSKHCTLQEKVFVLADPDVFTAQLEATVRAYLEVSGVFRDTPTAMEKNLMLRVMQKGLGTACRSSRLAQALEALDVQMVEKYFEEVVRAVEQSIKHGPGGCTTYLNRLQHIQKEILAAATEEVTEEDCGSVSSRTLLFPEIKFLLWTNEEDLWSLLANFSLRSNSNSSVDGDEKDKRDGAEDGGIKRRLRDVSDLQDTVQPLVRNPSLAMSRRNAYKRGNSENKLSLMREKMDTFAGSRRVQRDDCRCLTARVVVMGDDRVLGRLSRAFLSIRQRESKHLVLTKKLNLQLYYVPVTDVEPQPSSPDGPCPDNGRLSLAGLLGRLDPWYNSNINSLRATISNLATMHTESESEKDQNLFLLDTLCYYLRCGTQPVNLPMYSVKMTRCSSDASPVVEDVFVSHLEADMPEFRHLKEKFSKDPFTRRKKSTVIIHGAVITVSYTETSLSKRRVERGEALMTCGVAITSEPAAVTTGEDFLTVSFDSINPGNNKKIRTQNISIRTMEDQTLSVCLDRDTRRTYTDVQRIDISPCLDPGCSLRSKFTVRNKRELPLSKYLNNVLSLPINTFTGGTP